MPAMRPCRGRDVTSLPATILRASKPSQNGIGSPGALAIPVALPGEAMNVILAAGDDTRLNTDRVCADCLYRTRNSRRG